MTENQELQAFDETLKKFLKEPDHFLTPEKRKKSFIQNILPGTH